MKSQIENQFQYALDSMANHTPNCSPNKGMGFCGQFELTKKTKSVIEKKGNRSCTICGNELSLYNKGFVCCRHKV